MSSPAVLANRIVVSIARVFVGLLLLGYIAMHTKSILHAAAVALAFTAVPLAFSPEKGLTVNDACAQSVKVPGTGTCCYQTSALCVTPTGNIEGRYYKSEGMC